MATSPDSRYTAAVHRSAKIRQSQSSYVSKTLGDIAGRFKKMNILKNVRLRYERGAIWEK